MKNGFNDLLLKFDNKGFVLIAGGSPEGCAFLNEKFGVSTTLILNEDVGPLVSEAVMSHRLSLTIT